MLDQAYDDNFKYEASYWWFLGRRRIVFDFLKRALSSTAKPRILDYGCGTGKTLEILSESYDVVGVDESQTSIDYCLRRGLENAYLLSKLEENPDWTFDVVIMMDVLEHIEDSIAALKRIGKILRPEGFLLITVPAYNFLWGDEDILSQHIRRYTATSLGKEVVAAEFEIIRISYFNMLLLPIITAIIGARRVLQTNGQMPKTNLQPTPALINGILTLILYLEATFLKFINFPAGASIILLARKKR